MEGEGLINVAPAAATAVVNYNLLETEEILSVSKFKREITHMGLAGSAAINDTVVNLYIAGEYTGTIRNTTAGAVIVQPDDDLIPCSIIVPSGDKISARVVDAPATNPINLVIITRRKK